MAVPETIQPLVDKYTFHRDAYIRGQEKYNEAQLRQDFTDPFFHALGWDVNNNKGHSEAYREVMHGEPIRIRGTTFFFDYTFRIGGIRKFIVETKKPSVRIKDDADSALQLRRYAWNAKLPLSILTNFEEFAIYDCTIKPEHGDNAAKGRIEYFAYNEIPAKWEYLVSIFSQESILKGSFDKYAGSQKGRKGTATVDDDILTEIESWRDALAKNIAIRNPALSVDELNTVVQRTIDRLLFLRICEDRGIEEYTTLHKLLEGEHVYVRLCEHFRQADAKYNSGLFHFEKEPDWNEMPDTLSLSLTIDDKVLKGILKRLYYPETPYLFSVIPPEILGHVYEQFLGKVIRLTDGHQAKVEYKPEVKKAGGVFYTPQYIVEYIVKHTVGELTMDKTPRDVAKLRVLDPACGSGSFLIGAYQFLLDWHRDWYIENLVPVFIDKKSVADPAVLALLPEATPRGKKHLAQAELPIYKAGTSGDTTRTRSDWRLTTIEKKRILLNNIFGVDIDQQAVEVTKLSLLLKVLEEENEENIDKQLKLFAERALPSLHQNIKCGNSLIGTDILTPEMPSDEVKRINPFDWSREFAPVMAAGGFDAVIGNPPYVRGINLKESQPVTWSYCQSNYQSSSSRDWDIYLVFVEKGLGLINSHGRLGYILPNKFLNSQVGENLREIIANGHYLESIIHFGAFQVFKDATTYTCLLFLKKSGSSTAEVFRYKGDLNGSGKNCALPDNNSSIWSLSNVSSEELSEKTWNFFTSSMSLQLKFNKLPKLGEFVQIYQGTGTRADKVYIIENRGQTNTFIKIYSNEKQTEFEIENLLLRPVLRGRDIDRYAISKNNILLLVPYELLNGRATLIDPKKFLQIAPRTKDYLNACKSRLEEREDGRFKGEFFYQYGRPQNMDRYEVPVKIVLPDIAERGRCYLDTNGRWLVDTTYGIVAKAGTNFDLCYLLGILNSPLLTFYLKETGTALRGGYFRMKTAYLNPFPIRTINFADPTDKARHDRMVALVTQMLELNKKLQDASLDHEKTLLSRQVEAADGAIDKLVYELYGLTEEEIAIVESGGGK